MLLIVFVSDVISVLNLMLSMCFYMMLVMCLYLMLLMYFLSYVGNVWLSDVLVCLFLLLIIDLYLMYWRVCI
jgi:hypothetical protein